MTGPTAVAEDRYAGLFARQAQSDTLRAVYRDVYGDDYPEELDPFGFVTRTDLRRIVELLALSPGDRVADIGCGRGGPGLWVARATGARLTGVDVVPVAVADAAARSHDFGVRDAGFVVGGFTATGLPDGACAGVMSVDALWMVPDKPAAAAEVARILAPGARFAITTWETAHVDHLALFADAGLAVEVREETPDWLARQQAVYARITAAAPQLERELGRDGAAALLTEARETPAVLAETPRLLIAGHRPER